MTVEPEHKYINEPEIYDEFKFKKTHGLYKNISAL